ncbi:MAG: patatin-like phospholipase family protein [Saprospiraceae bacterium]
MKTNPKKVRILSIDGGGIRGIIPAIVLNYIEKCIRSNIKTRVQEHVKKAFSEASLDDFLENNVRISHFFDLVAGTSTGGILTCLYLCPPPQQNDAAPQLRKASEVIELYEKFGGEVFSNPLWHRLSSGFGYTDPKYNSEPFENITAQFFGDRRLSELVKPCLVTAYDIEDRKAVLFTSNDARQKNQSETKDFYVRDVARATSAAPTYFKPTRVRNILGAPFDLIDGGLYANNPALCAYAEARKINFSKFDNYKKDQPSAEDMLIVSLGTGSVKSPYHYEKMEGAGAIGWIEPVIDILMSSNSETIDYIVKQLYETLQPADCQDYYRLEPALLNAESAMDNAAPENIKNLKSDAYEFISRNVPIIDAIAEKLLCNGNEMESLMEQFEMQL